MTATGQGGIDSFRELIERSAAIMAVCDADGTVRYESPAFARVHGRQQDARIGRHAFDLIHPDDLPRIRATAAESLASPGRAIPWEARFQDGSEGWRWLEGQWLNLLNDPMVAGIVINCLDVTERCGLEERLRQFERAVEQSPFSIVITDLAGCIQYVNPKFCEMTGYSASEAIGNEPRRLLGEESPEQTYRELLQTLASGSEWQGEFNHRRKDGTHFWERAHISTITDGSGRPSHYLAVKFDITREKEIQEALRTSEEKFRALAEHAQDAVIMLNGAGEVVMWNPAAERIFGYPAGRAMRQDVHALIAPDRYRDTYARAIEKFRSTGTGAAVGRCVELEARRSDGVEIPIELSLGVAHTADGLMAIGIVRDISERRSAEQELAISLERFRLAFQNSAIGKALITPEGVIVEVNPALCRMTGREAGELEWMSLFDCIHPGSVKKTTECFARLATGKIPHFRLECRMSKASGEPLWGDLTCSLIRAQDGRPVSGIVQILDTTERHEHSEELHGAIECLEEANARLMQERAERAHIESELMLANKLQAVGQLAAGIAHEINTPMQFIGDSARFIVRSVPGLIASFEACRKAVGVLAKLPDQAAVSTEVEAVLEDADTAFTLAELPRALARIEEGVSRVSSLVRAMKEFGHPGQREKTPADLNHLIENTLLVARNEYKYVADAVTQLGDLPPTPCVVGEINQVLLNLLVNAAHAIAEKVDSTSDRGLISIRTFLDSEDAVVEISDTGGGIPAEIGTRVFEPFFTTKAPGKGTGQGLALARSIVVDRHGGQLTFTSRPGVGTTFTIRLPLAARVLLREAAA